MSVVHDFHESLAASHKASDLPIWEEIYSTAFPGYLTCVDHREDGEHQRAGIDRSVILENSKQILIDEKIRYEDYGDIALEYLSNDVRGTPGWVCKPLRADYICYAINPTQIAYLLPVLQLQQAWSDNGMYWRQAYGERSANNGTYRTWFCPVPVNALFPAIGKALRIPFGRVQ